MSNEELIHAAAVPFEAARQIAAAPEGHRGRLSLLKTIDEDRRERHDHINRSGRSTYTEENSVQTSGATPVHEAGHLAR